MDRGIVRVAIKQLVSATPSFFIDPADDGQFRWNFRPIVAGRNSRREDSAAVVRAIGTLLGIHLVWYAVACVPISVWVIFWLVEEEEGVGRLPLANICALDSAAAEELVHWPGEEPEVWPENVKARMIPMFLDMQVCSIPFYFTQTVAHRSSSQKTVLI